MIKPHLGDSNGPGESREGKFHIKQDIRMGTEDDVISSNYYNIGLLYKLGEKQFLP